MTTWGRSRSSRTRTQHKHQHPPTHCQQCGATGRLHQDHIINLANGGTDTINNMQWLCTTCHHTKTEHERKTSWQHKQQYRNKRRHLPQRPHPGD